MKKLLLIFAVLVSVTFISAQERVNFPMYTILWKDKIQKFKNEFFGNRVFVAEDYQTNIKEYKDRYETENNATLQNGKTELKSYITDEFYAITPFENGVVNGIKKIYDNQGNLRSEIPYLKGKLQGIQKIYDEYNNVVAEIPYKNGVKNGMKKVSFTDRRDDDGVFTISGNYSNGMLTDRITITQNYTKILYPSDFKKGKVEMFIKDAILISYSIIEEDVKHGPYTIYDIGFVAKDSQEKIESKKIGSGSYFMGKLHGDIEQYNTNGDLLFKIAYQFGNPVGKHITYYSKDKIESESYYDQGGKKYGKWITYTKDSKISSIKNYHNNTLEGVSETYYNGNLSTSENYVNGKAHGIFKNYDHKTGKLLYENHYENGKQISYTEFLPSGKKKMEIVYFSDLATEKRYYDKNGNIIYTNKYAKNNVPVGEHRDYSYNENEDYQLYHLTKYNSKGEKIYTNWTSGNSSNEIEWKNGMKHGKSVRTDDKGVKTVTYFYKDQTVSEEEYKKKIKEDN